MRTLRRRRAGAVRTALALLLGVAGALLAGCGGSSAKLIPSADAGPLQSDFEAVAQAAEGGGGCSATERALAHTERDFDALPAGIDAGLRDRLREGIAKLREDALSACAQSQTQSTSTQTRTASKTTSTSTSTQSTQTSTPETQTSTSSSSTATPPGEGAGEGGGGTRVPQENAPAGPGSAGGTGAGEGKAGEGEGAGAPGSAAPGPRGIARGPRAHGGRGRFSYGGER